MASERTGESTSLWAGLAVGLGICVAVGLLGVVVFLMRRQSGQSPIQIFGQPPQYLPMPMAGTIPPMAASQSSAPVRGGGAPAVPFHPLTAASTRVLPALGTASQAIRVAGNLHHPVRVTIRPVGPPGTLAVLSFSAAELNMPGLNPVTPAGYVFSIPVGHAETFDLDRGQSLFAKASDPGVHLSVASARVPGA